MEILWFVLGIIMLAGATYLYFYDIEFDKLGYLYLAGSMSILLSIFRWVFRKLQSDSSDS